MDASSLQHANRRVYIIDDLLGAILLIAAAALVVLLDLTRRQICAVYQLAFALCAASVFFIVGGLIDHHLSNEQLNMALYGSYLSSSLTTSYIYLPTLASLGVSVGVLFSLSTCSCDCCCLAGASASTHARCFSSRIRANGSLYGTCFLWLYVAIGTRLNVRLRESAINPVGGTLHWMLLRSPFYLAMAHIGSLLLVGLKVFLQHADAAPTPHARMDLSVHQLEAAKLRANPANPAMATASIQSSSHAMVEELMRPPPAKPFALATRRVNETGKQALPRSPQAVTVTAKSELKASPRAVPLASSKGSRRPSGSNNNREPQNDGDVSSLISSDSDSDDGVLRPSFRPSSSSEASAASARSAKTLPPRHSTSTGGVVRKRPSGGSASGYSSSPPPSPTHSTASSGSFSTSRARAHPAARPGSSSSSSSRPRLNSSGSSASTMFLSDNEDHLLSNLEAYGSSGNEASYASDYRPAAGIRRRAPSLGSTAAAIRRPSVAASPAVATSEWMECLDEATGSAYYYNTLTGESRWKEQ